MRRRRFLGTLAAAPFAASLPAMAQAAKPARLLVLVYLHGGNDNFNTWIPYADARYRELRPTIAVPRDAVLKVTDRQGFHPALAPLMRPWERGELAIVQGIGIPGITQQHYRDSEMAFTGAGEGEYPASGWAMRVLARMSPPQGALADAVAFDLLDIRASDPMGPFRGGMRPVIQIHHPEEWIAKRRVADCVHDANAAAQPLVASLPTLPAVALRTPFPGDQFGRAVRAAVDLAAADRGVRAIHVALNGEDGDRHHSVDNHWEQNKYHPDALARLAAGLAALREGLVEIGRWDETLVVTYDEFGRSPVENDKAGTHHGNASVHFAMGGRVKGGLVGEPPELVRVHQIGGPEPVIDTRRLWTTVASRWWGVDASNLFSARHPPLDILRA
jgi:uncharacterized protein (DUF1501 family)